MALGVITIGKVRIKKMRIKLEVMRRGVVYIAATWICTKSFWFLRPTDELLSFRSRTSEPWGPTRVAKISSVRC